MPCRNDKKALRNIFEFVTIVTALSLFLSLAAISVLNDMYALVKPDEAVNISIESPMSLSEISSLLGSKRIIKNPAIFSLFIKSKNRQEKLESFVGELNLRSNMSYREIMLNFY